MGTSPGHGNPLSCLWLSADVPSAGASGRVTYSGGLAQALARAGARVVGLGLTSTASTPTLAPSGDVEWRPIPARRRSAVTSLASRLPKMAHALAVREYRSAITRAVGERPWDAVIVDHLQMGWAVPLIQHRQPDAVIVYASQNHESSVRREVAEALPVSSARRYALWLDAVKASRLERRVVGAARLVTTVTEIDAELFTADRPQVSLVLPPGYGGPVVGERRITPDLPRRAVVLGNLDWHVKQANLRSLLRAADARFATAGAEILVVGPAPADFVASLGDLRATTFTGWVDDLGPLLASARLGIVAEPLGGGFKLKSLDYVFNRVPMAVLAGSADGLPLVPGRDYLAAPAVTDLAVDAVAALDDLEYLNRLHERAFVACRSAFDWSDRGESLHAAVAGLSRRRRRRAPGEGGMRCLVHDFSGHPFQVQLSRELARRGHEVLHLYCPSYESGRGDLRVHPSDPTTFSVEAIDLGRRFRRYSSTRRPFQELSYGQLVVERMRRFGPDVVLSSNDPLLAKVVAARWCSRTDTPWVFWLQDIYSIAMGNVARDRYPVAGPVLGAGFGRIERWLLRKAAAVVPITADFVPVLARWGIDTGKCTVIENWAPVDELAPASPENAWAAEHGFMGRRVLLYSGTLGLKHDPGLLLDLAAHVQPRGDTVVVVISEGMGADWLREHRPAGLDSLALLEYQPYERLAEVLATADVNLVLLQPDAGVFSVPSKVLTYHCAGRPMLAAMPSTNLAARIIVSQGSGLVVDGGDRTAFLSAADRLLDDEDLRLDMGRNGRRYAEDAFAIDGIADQFENVLRATRARGQEQLNRRKISAVR